MNPNRFIRAYVTMTATHNDAVSQHFLLEALKHADKDRSDHIAAQLDPLLNGDVTLTDELTTWLRHNPDPNYRATYHRGPGTPFAHTSEDLRTENNVAVRVAMLTKSAHYTDDDIDTVIQKMSKQFARKVITFPQTVPPAIMAAAIARFGTVTAGYNNTVRTAVTDAATDRRYATHIARHPGIPAHIRITALGHVTPNDLPDAITAVINSDLPQLRSGEPGTNDEGWFLTQVLSQYTGKITCQAAEALVHAVKAAGDRFSIDLNKLPRWKEAMQTPVTAANADERELFDNANSTDELRQAWNLVPDEFKARTAQRYLRHYWCDTSFHDELRPLYNGRIEHLIHDDPTMWAGWILANRDAFLTVTKARHPYNRLRDIAPTRDKLRYLSYQDRETEGVSPADRIRWIAEELPTNDSGEDPRWESIVRSLITPEEVIDHIPWQHFEKALSTGSLGINLLNAYHAKLTALAENLTPGQVHDMLAHVLAPDTPTGAALSGLHTALAA